jgi:hypothetical protein
VSSLTTYLSLIKPAVDDIVDIANINDNMDSLDSKWSGLAPTTAVMSDSPDAGASTKVSFADHRHGMPGFGVPVALGGSNQEGSATTVARSDHVHLSGTVADGWFNHGPETFDLEAANTEDMRVYVPSVPDTATLVLHGRALRAGLLAAHTHSTTSNVSATSTTGTGSAVTSSDGSADHTHTATTGAVSGGGAHIHSGPAHTHTIAAHTHDANRNADVSSPPWSFNLDAGAGTTVTSSLIGNTALTTDSSGTASSGSTGVDHTHSVTTGGVSANHNPQVTLSSHAHTINVTNNAVVSTSIGSGGFTASTRPAGVTVTIDGTSRTVALAGPWGSSGSDWDQEAINVLPYLQSAGWHTFEFGGTTGGRLKAQLILHL